MTKFINAGVIGCKMSEEFFSISGSNTMETFHWKKIWAAEQCAPSVLKRYPKAEVVNTADSIIHDNDITLVIVSSDYMGWVQPVIDAGKAVKII